MLEISRRRRIALRDSARASAAAFPAREAPRLRVCQKSDEMRRVVMIYIAERVEAAFGVAAAGCWRTLCRLNEPARSSVWCEPFPAKREFSYGTCFCYGVGAHIFVCTSIFCVYIPNSIY